MNIVILLLLIFFILTTVIGLVFMNRLIKLQKENNELLKNMLENKSSDHKSNDGPMPHTELEKFKTQFMQNPYQPPKRKRNLYFHKSLIGRYQLI